MGEKKKQRLEKRQNSLNEELDALHEQLGKLLDEGHKVKIKRRIEEVESELEQIESELAQIKTATTLESFIESSVLGIGLKNTTDKALAQRLQEWKYVHQHVQNLFITVSRVDNDIDKLPMKIHQARREEAQEIVMFIKQTWKWTGIEQIKRIRDVFEKIEIISHDLFDEFTQFANRENNLSRLNTMFDDENTALSINYSVRELHGILMNILDLADKEIIKIAEELERRTI